MTLETTDNRKEYIGDGVSDTFSYPYYFLADTDLVVYKEDVLQALTTHYTVTGAGIPAGGSVVFVTPPPDTENVVIYRDPILIQESDWVENDPDPAAQKENAFDLSMMVSQRLSERVDRSLSLPDSDVGISIEMPVAADRASRYLGFDEFGNVAVLQAPTPLTEAQVVNTLAALQSLDIPDAGATAIIKGRSTDGDGGYGLFNWSGSDLSTEVAADSNFGVHVPPTSDLTGASGAWVRAFKAGWYDPAWFGAIGDGVTDDTVAITAAIAVMPESSTLFPRDGIYLISTLVINKNISIRGNTTWASGVDGGVIFTSATAAVPVLDFTSAAASHLRLTGIRVKANVNSTACIRIHTAHNGFQIDNVFLKGIGCPTGLLVNNGSYLKLRDIYTSDFSDANITNTGCARLIINGGLHDVGTNAFVFINGLVGGNLLIKDTYVEWTSGTRDLVTLTNTTTATDVVLENIYQTSTAPNALVRKTNNVAAPVIRSSNYRGSSPTYFYKDDDAASQSVAWDDNKHKGVVAYHQQLTEIFKTLPNFSDGDTTPSIASYKVFRTNNTGATTITDLDDGFEGETVTIIFLDNNTTVDFTFSSLKGNGGVNWTPSNGDHMVCTLWNTNWYCAVSDNTISRIEIDNIGTLADDATPSVIAGKVFLTGGTTTITDFDDGVPGQVIEIHSEHAITITDGTNILLAGSADFVMAATDTLTLRQKADGKWYETSRSVN